MPGRRLSTVETRVVVLPPGDRVGDASRRPRRLANPVVEAFVDQIVSGTIPPRSALPKEAALCEHFEVSRSVIREVLKVLEQKGLVVVRNGKGAWTTDRDSWDLLDPLVLSTRVRYDKDRSFFANLVTVRTVLEAEMAAQAATRVSEEQLAEVGNLVDELGRSMNDVPRYVDLDIRFHDLVMRISGNELGRSVVFAIIEQARSYPRYGSADLGHVRRSQPGHLAVYKALADHDPAAAQAAIREHVAGGAYVEGAHGKAPA